MGEWRVPHCALNRYWMSVSACATFFKVKSLLLFVGWGPSFLQIRSECCMEEQKSSFVGNVTLLLDHPPSSQSVSELKKASFSGSYINCFIYG